MSIISSEILAYHKIFCKNILAEETKQEITNIADYLRKELPIEKLFLFGSTVYGHPNKNSDYDFLLVIDCDREYIDEVLKAYQQIKGVFSRSVHTLPTPLSGFDKRASQPTDIEFYIYNYGILLFDSGKSATVKALTPTVYSAAKDNYDFLESCTSLTPDLSIIEVYLNTLLKLYACKKAYSPLDDYTKNKDMISYVLLFADDTVKAVIAKYMRLCSDKNKMNILAKLITDFADYVLSLKKDKNVATTKYVYSPKFKVTA